MATGKILFTAVFSALTLNAAFADNTTISDTPMRKTIPEKITADLTFHMLFSMWDMTLAKDGRWVVKSSSSTEELKAQ